MSQQESQQPSQQQSERDRQNEEDAKKWPATVEGEGRRSAADQDIGPESTPSRTGK
jgi:hypothetical protein